VRAGYRAEDSTVPGNVQRSVSILSARTYPTVLADYVTAIDQVCDRASQTAESRQDRDTIQGRIQSLQESLHAHAKRLDTCYDAILANRNILGACEDMVSALRLAIQDVEGLQQVAVDVGLAHGLPQAQLQQQSAQGLAPVCAIMQA
jgi:hypothetical protein